MIDLSHMIDSQVLNASTIFMFVYAIRFELNQIDFNASSTPLSSSHPSSSSPKKGKKGNDSDS
jgi:hypothetical protein